MSEDNAVGPCVRCHKYTTFRPGAAVPGKCEHCGAPFPQSMLEGKTGIEPALTVEQWDSMEDKTYGVVGHGTLLDAHVRKFLQDEPAAAVAVANHLLPDSDPRKITREMVDAIIAAANEVVEKGGSGDHYEALLRYADALESYLPPTDG